MALAHQSSYYYTTKAAIHLKDAATALGPRAVAGPTPDDALVELSAPTPESAATWRIANTLADHTAQASKMQLVNNFERE